MKYETTNRSQARSLGIFSLYVLGSFLALIVLSSLYSNPPAFAKVHTVDFPTPQNCQKSLERYFKAHPTWTYQNADDSVMLTFRLNAVEEAAQLCEGLLN